MRLVIFWTSLMGLLAAVGAGYGVFEAIHTDHDDALIALVAAVFSGMAATTPFVVAGAVVTLLVDVRDRLDDGSRGR